MRLPEQQTIVVSAFYKFFTGLWMSMRRAAFRGAVTVASIINSTPAHVKSLFVAFHRLIVICAIGTAAMKFTLERN